MFGFPNSKRKHRSGRHRTIEQKTEALAYERLMERVKTDPIAEAAFIEKYTGVKILPAKGSK